MVFTRLTNRRAGLIFVRRVQHREPRRNAPSFLRRREASGLEAVSFSLQARRVARRPVALSIRGGTSEQTELSQ